MSRYANWRVDLDASRDLNDLEKQNCGFVLGWFEIWWLRQGLRAERPPRRPVLEGAGAGQAAQGLAAGALGGFGLMDD